MIEKKKKTIPLSFIYGIKHILAAIYPRPMNMVTNVSLGSGLSSDVSHMQIIQVVYKGILMKTLKNIKKIYKCI